MIYWKKMEEIRNKIMIIKTKNKNMSKLNSKNDIAMFLYLKFQQL